MGAIKHALFMACAALLLLAGCTTSLESEGRWQAISATS